ncbi:MAG: hypothetical protein FWH05_03770 [Oscillospiraceae bacterium]|nr:hypothetical protein [Oscillospiraceae bacterium]
MKKFIAKLLPLLVFISFCIVNFSIVTSVGANTNVTISVGAVVASPGDSNVRVPITISGNPGIADAILMFDIPAGITLTSFDGTGGMRVDPISSISTRIVLLENTTATGYTGTHLLSLVISIPSNTSPGLKPITILPSSSLSGPGAIPRSITADYTPGGITVSGQNQTQPVTSPTQPVTSPTQPVTSPTQPVTSPTQPVTSPTQPVTSPSTQTNPNTFQPITSLPATVPSRVAQSTTASTRAAPTETAATRAASAKARLNRFFSNNITVIELRNESNSARVITVRPDRRISDRKNIRLYTYNTATNRLAPIRNANIQIGKTTGAVRFNTNANGLIVISDGPLNRR